MTAVDAPDAAASARPDPVPARPPARRLLASGAAALAGLYLLAVAIYAVLGNAQPTAMVSPDEYFYSHLARSLAGGDGLVWRGDPAGLKAALYVYFIAPAWWLSHGVGAYDLAKLAGAFALCLQVVPVWILARDVVGPRVALVPALLSVAGTWMLAAAGILTENLAFPLTTASLCATVLALRRPGGRAIWVALGFAALAAWSRLQVVALFPVILVALAADVARFGSEWRARAREQRTALIAAGGVTAALVVGALVVGTGSATGIYDPVFGYRPSLARLGKLTGMQLAHLTAAVAFVPMLLAAGLAASRRAWRDPDAGPLLVVLWIGALAFAAQSGFMLAGFETEKQWAIQRYVVYVAPLAFVLVALVAVRPALVSRRALAVAAALGLVLLATPRPQVVGEERAVWATRHVLGGIPTGVALALVALAATAAVAHALRRLGGRGMTAALAVGGVLLAILVVQDQATWRWQLHVARTWRSQLPSDLRWLDDHTKGDAAVFAVLTSAPEFRDLTLFNDHVKALYSPPAPPLAGERFLTVPHCMWQAAADGTVTFDDGCGPVPRTFFINDSAVTVTFHDEVSEVREPRLGRLVTVGGPPRLQSLVINPCGRARITFTGIEYRTVPADAPRPCRGTLDIRTWLDARSVLTVRFRGGAEDHVATLGSRSWPLPKGVPTTVRIPVQAGSVQTLLQLDWDTTTGAPEMERVELGSGADAKLLT